MSGSFTGASRACSFHTDTVIHAHNEDSKKWHIYSKTSAPTLYVSHLIPLTFVLSAHLTKQTSKRYWTQWLLMPHQREVSLLPACAIALAQWFMKRRTICTQMGHRYKYSDQSEEGQRTLVLAQVIYNSKGIWTMLDSSTKKSPPVNGWKIKGKCKKTKKFWTIKLISHT